MNSELISELAEGDCAVQLGAFARCLAASGAELQGQSLNQFVEHAIEETVLRDLLARRRERRVVRELLEDPSFVC